MTEPAFFLGYRSVQPKDSSFTGTATKERKERGLAFMEADLAKSGLDFKDIHSDVSYHNPEGAVTAAYKIPYCFLDGKPIADGEGTLLMHRTRIDWSPRPVPDGTSKGKYTQPSKKQVGAELANAPYVPWGLDIGAGGDVLYICEGEKKTACVVKYLGVKAIGIGGKDQWRVTQDDTVSLHPWIAEAVAQYERVVIVPDGDIERWDIGKSYGYMSALISDLVPVTTLHPPDKIDDMIVAWLTDGLGVAEQFETIPELAEQLEDPKYLIREYKLTSEKKGEQIIVNENNIKKLLRNHPSMPHIWLNWDNNKIMFGEEEATPTEIDDVLFDRLQQNMTLTRLRKPMFLDCVSVISVANGRSPWLDWLTELEWDGVPRVGTMFNDYCLSTSPPEYLHMLATRWMVGSVARQFEPGVAVDFMVIAKGGQGIGKSWFPKRLFGAEHVTNIVGTESQHKDLLSKMHRGKCASLEELSTLNKREMEELKPLISDNWDVWRPPYGRTELDKPRRFVLYGSTNDVSPLKNDPSGYRRMGVVEYGQVQWDALEADREQLWAEAVHLYRVGDVRYVELDQGLMGHISDYAVEDPIVERLERILATGVGLVSYWDRGEGVWNMTMEELCRELDIKFSLGAPSVSIRAVKAYLEGTLKTHLINTNVRGRRRVWKIKVPEGYQGGDERF